MLYDIWWRKWFDDPEVLDNPKVISNENINVDDPQDVDNFSAFDDPKGISIGSMEFDKKKSLRWSPYSMVLFLKGQQSSFGEKQRKRVSELLYVTRILLEAIVLASFNYIHCPRSASHSFIHFPQSGLSGFCT